jgi:NADH dehydrogenase [ubiquinone] 1 alpha subcomplex assembly factor 5
VTRDPFDRQLRRLRRDRAQRQGVDLFLLDRAFADCLERVQAIARPFRHALLIGAPSPGWRVALEAVAGTVAVVDPGRLFAGAAHGQAADEDRFDYGEDRYDLVVAVGTLDTVNDLPLALQLVRRAMRADACLIGAVAGGELLPALRAALIEADRDSGRVVARVHPRIDGPTLTALLASAGFDQPVVDVDRVTLRYRRLADLVRDLRAMGATNIMDSVRFPLTRTAWARAAASFDAAGTDGRTAETVDILHFLAWTPLQG